MEARDHLVSDFSFADRNFEIRPTPTGMGTWTEAITELDAIQDTPSAVGTTATTVVPRLSWPPSGIAHPTLAECLAFSVRLIVENVQQQDDAYLSEFNIPTSQDPNLAPFPS